jgi:hypothetical protein
LALHRLICWVQGIYYLVSGLWPIVSIETFQLVTGRKTDNLVTGSEADHWLVNTIAALVIAIGLALLTAAWRGRGQIEIFVLGLGSALALTSIDVIYVARGAIYSIYLGDAVLELAFAIAWFVCIWRFQRSSNAG